MNFSVYFAGGLFSHKDLIGNLLLGEKIASESGGRYSCLLPQNIELADVRAGQIRDNDIAALLGADLALFNFDGTELDSGTVVEFMLAKTVDMPCVVLRTDFRSGGDQTGGEDQWNLMCSGYPRTVTLTVNAMSWYHRNFAGCGYASSSRGQAYTEIAGRVVSALDEVRQLPSIVTDDVVSLKDLYAWACRFPGGGLRRLLTDHEIERLAAAKAAKGLYKTS